jgi:hypothetical protein
MPLTGPGGGAGEGDGEGETAGLAGADVGGGVGFWASATDAAASNTAEVHEVRR